MARTFTLLSILTLLMIFCVGLLTYALSVPAIMQAKSASMQNQAQIIAKSLSSQLKQIQFNVDAMSELPEVVQAMQQNDPARLHAITDKLQQLTPNALAIRILDKNINTVDQYHFPEMGFADLQMVKATLSKPQLPVVQGTGKYRHLALTSLIQQKNKTFGILLVSLQVNFVKESLFAIADGFIELRQEKTILATSGKSEDKNTQSQVINIPHSNWQLYFWPDQKMPTSNIILIVTTISASALIACLGFFVGYRKLAEKLRQDQSTILNAAKNLLTNKISGNYPILLPELKPVISHLVQYKRVIDKNLDTELEQSPQLTDDFFEENLDSSFLDINRGIQVEEEQTPVAPKQPTETQSNQSDERYFTPTQQHNHTPSSSIFKQNHIGGIVGHDLSTDLMLKIGQALGSEAAAVNINLIVVARDGRHSSQAFADALIKGLTDTGRNVLDIGLVPTPLLYFVAHHSEGRSGVMITGSHNPKDYNGVNIVLNEETLEGEKILRLQSRIDNNDFIKQTKGSSEKNTSFTNEYIGIISEDIHIERPMKVVLDCGNGSASELGPILLRTLGCEVVELFCQIDGDFPNRPPDPTQAANLQSLIAAVTEQQADIGIALDGDGDRLGIVDSSGNIICPDKQLTLFAKHVLACKPGAQVIFDVNCSRQLTEQIKKSGGRPLMWKTSHASIVQKLKETGAVLAGEMSGHIILHDRWFAFDDALYAAARMIEILSIDNRTSSEVFADFPDNIKTEIDIAVGDGEKELLMERILLQANFQNGRITDVDGLRVDFQDGWGLVRASHDAPALQIHFEADNQTALQRIQSEFKQLLLHTKPNLSVPF